mmetsp:Transcript_28281/g.50536  ORF Transcript_28281/g.50536 Transcript_28281/m.50536 type:complete len:242 (-) Transcript_28281:224-949(-)
MARHLLHLLHAPLHCRYAGHRRFLLECGRCHLVHCSLRHAPHGPRLGGHLVNEPMVGWLASLARGVRHLRPFCSRPGHLRAGTSTCSWQFLPGRAPHQKDSCVEAWQADGPQQQRAQRGEMLGRGVVRLLRLVCVPLELEPAQQDAAADGGRVAQHREPRGDHAAEFRAFLRRHHGASSVRRPELAEACFIAGAGVRLRGGRVSLGLGGRLPFVPRAALRNTHSLVEGGGQQSWRAEGRNL